MNPVLRDRLAVVVAGVALVAAVLGVPGIPVAQIEPPPAPRVKISVGDAPSLGPETAPVTIIEFSDFQCHFSARGSRILRVLFELYPQQIRWVFKHFPLGADRGAALVHQAALAAHEQQKFWPFHDLLYATQGRRTMRDLQAAAAELGLDVELFTERLQGSEVRFRVKQDSLQGRMLGVVATPTYFVNGQRVAGVRSLAHFRKLIEQELAGAATATASSESGAKSATPHRP